jgi:hypothetical protein
MQCLRQTDEEDNIYIENNNFSENKPNQTNKEAL